MSDSVKHIETLIARAAEDGQTAAAAMQYAQAAANAANAMLAVREAGRTPAGLPKFTPPPDCFGVVLANGGCGFCGARRGQPCRASWDEAKGDFVIGPAT